MRHRIGLLTVGILLAMALAVGTVLGSGSQIDVRPSYATVKARVQPVAPPAGAKQEHGKASSKPKVVYLSGKGTVNTDPAAGGTGPYIDFKLTAPRNVCPRVINGGINAGSLDLFQQGSYVKKGKYHVLMGLDDNAAGTPTSFPYESQVICLKGVR